MAIEVMEQLLIPDRIKVGFDKRADTYTGKLAYVIYYDNKGTLRKQASWDNWRDKKIPSVEYANEPTEGFVLNKAGGGGRGWDARNEFIRVWDPRDFEFEISLPNLLFILRETDCSRGKGLEGKFVYAWQGTSLVLLPAGSEDYRRSKNFTDLQGKSVKSKEMVPGTIFTTKRQVDLVFVGKYDFYFAVDITEQWRAYRHRDELPVVTSDQLATKPGVQKRHIFWDPKSKYFLYLSDLKQIAALKSDTVVDNLAELTRKYGRSPHGSKILELFLQNTEPKKDPDDPHDYYSDMWYREEQPGVYTGYMGDDQRGYITRHQTCRLREDGIMLIRGGHESIHKYEYDRYGHGWHRDANTRLNNKWVTPTKSRLFARLESGVTVRVTTNNFKKD